ncbi:hypothetical protein Efla_001909 [Eimeria flavescens]
MQPPLGPPPPLQAPPARDPVTKLQILLGNLLKHFTDVVVHLSEVSPPRPLCPEAEAADSADAAAAKRPAGNTLTPQQLDEFILNCSRGVGSLVHLIEEETEKLPDENQSQADVESELRYLTQQNELAAEELKRLIAHARPLREAVREAYRSAATEGAEITIN